MNTGQAISTLTQFINPAQLNILRLNVKGEEGMYFADLLQQFAHRILHMHHTYEQDGMGEEAVVHLHYFMGVADWYITERDIHHDQLQAFGLADMGYGAELGYISLAEILAHGAELDLHWTPKTLAETKVEHNSK